MPRKIIKRPAFQMYPGDWLASTKIALMTIAQEGGYHRLLCHCWLDPDCSLPDDDAHLAVLSRLGDGWESGSQLIRSCFQIHPKKVGRLTNMRLLAERKKQDKWHRKSVDGGLKSAETRVRKGKGGSPLVGTIGATKGEGEGQPNANSSVFSLLSSSPTPEVPKEESKSLPASQPFEVDAEPGFVMNPEPDPNHPAIDIYRKVYGCGLPCIDDQVDIIAEVKNLDIWTQTITLLKRNKIPASKVGTLLKAYKDNLNSGSKSRSGYGATNGNGTGKEHVGSDKPKDFGFKPKSICGRED